MNTALDSLGLIAGNRSLPLEFARQARKLGVKRLIAVAFEGETDPALASLVDEIVWIKVGQLSQMISAFADRGQSIAGQLDVLQLAQRFFPQGGFRWGVFGRQDFGVHEPLRKCR